MIIIDNDRPICNAAMPSLAAVRRRKRKRPLSNSASCNDTINNFSICKFTRVITAACALLFCTASSTRPDVLAHSDSRMVSSATSNLVGNSDQHQIQTLQLSHYRDDNDKLPHNSNSNMNNMDFEMSIKSSHRDNNSNDDEPYDDKRILQRREEYGYGAYGVPPAQNSESEMNNENSDTSNNGDSNNSESKGWFGKKKTNENDTGGDMASNTYNSGNSYNSASGGYGSYYGSSTGASTPSYSSSSSYGSYGSSSGSSSNSNSGGYGSYGSSSTSAYGGASSPRSSSYYGGSSYSSTWGAGSASSSSSSSKWGSSSSRTGLRGGKGLHPVKIDLLKAIFFLLLISSSGMLLTAHVMENDPEGTFANCCRVSLHTVNCVYSIIYNLYHCRLGEIPGILCGGSELDDDEYTEEELERMTLRPGIERALDTEHRKALRKVGVEMNMIKPKNGGGGRKGRIDHAKSSKGVHNGENIQR